MHTLIRIGNMDFSRYKSIVWGEYQRFFQTMMVVDVANSEDVYEYYLDTTKASLYYTQNNV